MRGGKSLDLDCLPAKASSDFPIAFSPVHILAKTLHASLSPLFLLLLLLLLFLSAKDSNMG